MLGYPGAKSEIGSSRKTVAIPLINGMSRGLIIVPPPGSQVILKPFNLLTCCMPVVVMVKVVGLNKTPSSSTVIENLPQIVLSTSTLFGTASGDISVTEPIAG